MQKLMKNWIFTMVVCILLAILAVLMFLSGFDVGGMHIGQSIIHMVTAIALVIYTVFAICPLVARYRGALQGFVIGEAIILFATAIAHLCMEWFALPLLSDLAVCSVLGLALWLRGAVQTVHVYLSVAPQKADAKKEQKEEQKAQKPLPLWQLLCYILLSAVGVWQIAKPTIKDNVFVFVIGTVSLVIAAIFGYSTVINRRATADVRAVKKAQKAEKKAALAALKAAEPAAEPATEKAAEPAEKAAEPAAEPAEKAAEPAEKAAEPATEKAAEPAPEKNEEAPANDN